MEDWFQIHQLFIRYATALDDCDVDAVVDCFTADGWIESPALGRFSGASGIRDFADRTARLKAEHGAQFRHVLSNLRIEVDGHRASARCYLLDFITRDGKTELLSPGDYKCGLRRIQGQWRFESRVVHMDRPFEIKNMTDKKPPSVLKIWGSKGSSNVQKVLWCCGELGLPFEREDVSAEGRHKQPEYLARNPNGLIPTIDDEGFILWESNVIVRYLAAKHGMGTLYPTDPAHRADADRWMDWQQTAMAPHLGVLYRATLKSPPDDIAPAVFEAALQKASAAWTILDRHLATCPYVGGSALTMGDIALGNAVHRWFRLPVERPELPHLAAWYARLRDRPAYAEHIGWF